MKETGSKCPETRALALYALGTTCNMHAQAALVGLCKVVMKITSWGGYYKVTEEEEEAVCGCKGMSS